MSNFSVSPAFILPQIEQITNARLSEIERNIQNINTKRESVHKNVVPFDEMKLEDQIKASTVIALAKYEISSGRETKAIIREFLKKDPNTTIYYNIGDEYKRGSFFPKENVDYGDGLIIFFTGSPAEMKMSTNYIGDRILGLSDLPIALLKEKCKTSGTE